MFDIVSRRFKPFSATLAAAALAVSLSWLGAGEAGAQGKTITAVMQADVRSSIRSSTPPTSRRASP